ncbi:tyrosine-type recombinase/integrase [Kitasatospora sp. NPDC051984]|uniref:tyrosine-type recombinase/integrase n=1 Tax=Kitasatospora sp. NPDC051984 TaxID=3364059 RepID=UPI0037CA3647
MLTYDVRLYTIRKREGRRRPFELRWKVGSVPHSKSYVTKTLATGRLAQLKTAMKDGEQFDEETGLPVSELEKLREKEAPAEETWFGHAVKHVSMKWPDDSAKERSARADGLATLTPALVTDPRGGPSARVLRRALSCWAFNFSPQKGDPPPEIVAALEWIAERSVPISQLDESDVIREALTAITLKLDGTRAADNTIRRKYSTFSGALRYAVERKFFTANPLTFIDWSPPETDSEIDWRYVPGPHQARELVDATATLGPRGRHMSTLYGATNWIATRPSEAVNLRKEDCHLPAEGWGSAVLAKSSPRVGSRWTDDGKTYEERGLKHRARNSTRTVPIPPIYVQRLRAHVEEFGLGLDGRLFQSATGGLVSTKEYSDVWKEARELVLPPHQLDTPLAETPGKLRATCVSGWIAAGVDPTEVAYRAGHSVAVLFHFYAKVLNGRRDQANGLIEKFLDAEYGPGSGPQLAHEQ